MIFDDESWMLALKSWRSILLTFSLRLNLFIRQKRFEQRHSIFDVLMTLKMSTYVACSTQTFKSSVNLQADSMNSEYDMISLEALLSHYWILILNSMSSECDCSFAAISDFELRDATISCALRDLLRIDVEKLNHVRNSFLNQIIVLLLHALICNEEKAMKISQILKCKTNRAEFSMMFSMMFSERCVIINCCATIANLIWLEILNRNSYETNCITISIEKCKSWWL